MFWLRNKKIKFSLRTLNSSVQRIIPGNYVLNSLVYKGEMLSSLIFKSVASTAQNTKSINEFIFSHVIV